MEIQTGAQLIEATARRANSLDAERLLEWAKELRRGESLMGSGMTDNPAAHAVLDATKNNTKANAKMIFNCDFMTSPLGQANPPRRFRHGAVRPAHMGHEATIGCRGFMT